MLNSITGLTLIKSSFAVDTSVFEIDHIEIDRTWKERLFSLPWEPWKKTKTIEVRRPKPAIFKVGNVIYYHPSLEDKLREAIGNEKEKLWHQ